MTAIGTLPSRRIGVAALAPGLARGLMLTILIGAAATGLWATSAEAARRAAALAGADLTHLLRFMAVLKGAMAFGAAAALLWRLKAAVPPIRFAAYAGAASCMVAGPGLMWSMAHVGLGALLLHGGLVATLGLLWFDPATADILDRALRLKSRQPGRTAVRLR